MLDHVAIFCLYLGYRKVWSSRQGWNLILRLGLSWYSQGPSKWTQVVSGTVLDLVTAALTNMISLVVLVSDIIWCRVCGIVFVVTQLLVMYSYIFVLVVTSIVRLSHTYQYHMTFYCLNVFWGSMLLIWDDWLVYWRNWLILIVIFRGFPDSDSSYC